jgi:predicted acetyltransferase
MSFGHRVADASMESAKAIIEPERSIVAEVDDRIVGTAGVFSFELTVPGGQIPAAGVTMVGVLPTHRRRGVLSTMMRHQLEDIASRGEPLAVLWASEGQIYGRYGYGMATLSSRIDILKERATFLTPMPKGVTTRLVETEEAIPVMNEVYDRVRAYTPGFYARSQTWWRHHRLREHPHEAGGPPTFKAILEIEGRPYGYCFYKLHHDWTEGSPGGRLEVLEAVADGTEATRALWDYLFGIDLVGHIECWALGPDLPLAWMLQDPRRLRNMISDGVWARITDVVSALEARGYQSDGTLVIEVRDQQLGSNSGTWRLDVNDGRATVTASDEAADLSMGIAELSATYLGGVRATVLLEAGRITEHREGAARRAEAMLSWYQTPWCPEIF